jgi:hypothetical protein
MMYESCLKKKLEEICQLKSCKSIQMTVSLLITPPQRMAGIPQTLNAVANT